MRVDDYFPFGCGDQICRCDDERHVGVVVAVISNTVRVRWENGWREDCDPRDILKLSQVNRYGERVWPKRAAKKQVSGMPRRWE